jgi:hypothetical protein
MLIHEGDEDQADVLRMAEEMKIPDNDDLVSELSAKIPALHSKKAPKVVDGATLMDLRATQQSLAFAFDLIDRELDMQVFNGPHDPPRMSLEIKTLKQLGGGSQGEVYKIKIQGMRGYFCDKSRKIYNNAVLAEKTLEDMYGEFCIAKDLQHENIIQHKYFLRKYVPSTKNYEFHIVMELMDGDDMEQFLKDQGRPYIIDKIKEVGKQLISALKYIHERKIIH